LHHLLSPSIYRFAGEKDMVDVNFFQKRFFFVVCEREFQGAGVMAGEVREENELDCEYKYMWQEGTLSNSRSPADWSGRHVDSCGIAAAELRPRRRYDEEAQRRPAESEVPGTQISSPP
jgi:hypothetical protein